MTHDSEMIEAVAAHFCDHGDDQWEDDSGFIHACDVCVEKARTWVADPDTLTISKVDGEWPLGLVELAAITLCDMDDDPKWSELDSVYSESMADQVREICRANTKAALDALLEGLKNEI